MNEGSAASGEKPSAGADSFPGTVLPRLLVVDDEPSNRRVCRRTLEEIGILCWEASSGAEALEMVGREHFDLVLLDIDMPEVTGAEVLARLRQNPPAPYLKVIVISGRATGDEMARMMRAGADDYLTKPFSLVQLRERVKAALRLRAAQVRGDQFQHELLKVNREMERGLSARDSDIVHARNALVMALAELVAQRDAETGSHLLRLQHFSRCLAVEAARLPGFAGHVDPPFVEMLACCAPLHDIGKVAVPDHILLKPGRLTPEERLLMQRHTVVAGATLRKVARGHVFAGAFLQMAEEIARHHHEKYDGSGYPDGLVGDAIPLAARILAIADVYDALRSPRVYKAGMAHADAVRIILEESPGHFDPALIEVFRRCGGEFERLYGELGD